MRYCVNKPYRITLPYGATTAPYSKSNPHNGVDLVSDDKYIVAPEAGTITSYGVNGKSGNMMVLQGKYRHSFSHIKVNGNIVGIGAKVKEGQKIAVMGSTGFASGVHVHWVVNSGTIDPESIIKSEVIMYKGHSAKYWYLQYIKERRKVTEAGKFKTLAAKVKALLPFTK